MTGEFEKILANNRQWAAEKVSADTEFFSRNSASQSPTFLWIGCSDSRVPANLVTGLEPGDVFVHRNIANAVPPDDANINSVIQYAVTALQVKHIVVCGHYGCGGVQAALNDTDLPSPLADWIVPLREIRDRHAEELQTLPDDNARWRRLCELNAIEQAETVAGLPVVQEAWQAGQPLTVHACIYDLEDGLLTDLEVSRSA